jgi:tRNA A-37 threonylcarbamoyl transferase component Bud32
MFNMEKLNEAQRQRVTKMPDMRLVHKLTQAGIPVDKIEAMDRQAMQAVMAEIVSAGKEAEAVAVAPVVFGLELEK